MSRKGEIFIKEKATVGEQGISKDIIPMVAPNLGLECKKRREDRTIAITRVITQGAIYLAQVQ